MFSILPRNYFREISEGGLDGKSTEVSKRKTHEGISKKKIRWHFGSKNTRISWIFSGKKLLRESVKKIPNEILNRFWKVSIQQLLKKQFMGDFLKHFLHKFLEEFREEYPKKSLEDGMKEPLNEFLRQPRKFP